MFGDGEIGFDFLPDLDIPLCEQQDLVEGMKALSEDDLFHAYSTVFVVISSTTIHVNR